MASKKLLKTIQVQTNICIQSICKKGKCTTVTPLYRELKILQIDDLIELELAKFRYRIVNKKYPDVLLEILNSHGNRKEHRYLTRHKKPAKYTETYRSPVQYELHMQGYNNIYPATK